jgi:hypothetical protein
VNCIDCGRDEKIVSNGRCVNCASKHWRQNNPDKARQSSREASRRYDRNRRSSWARRARLEGDRRQHLTVADLMNLQDDTPNCRCCGVRLDYDSRQPNPAQASIDKVIPAIGYRPGNVQVVCVTCNRNKHNTTLVYLDMLVAYVRRYSPAPAGATAAEPEPEPEDFATRIARSAAEHLARFS